MSAAVQTPVRFGSLMYGYRLPRLSRLREVSLPLQFGRHPEIHASLPPVRGRNSSAWKKNSLLLPPGFPIGPPIE